MSTSGIAIHYIGWGCQSSNPQVVLNGNFVFDLHDVFQERNPGIKQELPVISKQVIWKDMETSHCFMVLFQDYWRDLLHTKTRVLTAWLQYMF
jgi:hypothetical protein